MSSTSRDVTPSDVSPRSHDVTPSDVIPIDVSPRSHDLTPRSRDVTPSDVIPRSHDLRCLGPLPNSEPRACQIRSKWRHVWEARLEPREVVPHPEKVLPYPEQVLPKSEKGPQQ